MSDPQPTFDKAEQAAPEEIGRRLRAQGWADHVTVAKLLSDWRNLASSVDRYSLSIDDYTNDLTSRDGLELVLAACAASLRDKLHPWVDAADREFTERTETDADEAFGHFYRVDDLSGWWWKRRPTKGPLADYLAEVM